MLVRTARTYFYKRQQIKIKQSNRSNEIQKQETSANQPEL